MHRMPVFFVGITVRSYMRRLPFFATNIALPIVFPQKQTATIENAGEGSA